MRARGGLAREVEKSGKEAMFHFLGSGENSLIIVYYYAWHFIICEHLHTETRTYGSVDLFDFSLLLIYMYLGLSFGTRI